MIRNRGTPPHQVAAIGTALNEGVGPGPGNARGRGTTKTEGKTNRDRRTALEANLEINSGNRVGRVNQEGVDVLGTTKIEDREERRGITGIKNKDPITGVPMAPLVVEIGKGEGIGPEETGDQVATIGRREEMIGGDPVDRPSRRGKFEPLAVTRR